MNLSRLRHILLGGEKGWGADRPARAASGHLTQTRSGGRVVYGTGLIIRQSI